MTSVAVFGGYGKLVVRLVDFISLGRVRAKPYILEIDISEMRSQDTCNTHVCKLSHSTHMQFV